MVIKAINWSLNNQLMAFVFFLSGTTELMSKTHMFCIYMDSPFTYEPFRSREYFRKQHLFKIPFAFSVGNSLPRALPGKIYGDVLAPFDLSLFDETLCQAKIKTG